MKTTTAPALSVPNNGKFAQVHVGSDVVMRRLDAERVLFVGRAADCALNFGSLPEFIAVSFDGEVSLFRAKAATAEFVRYEPTEPEAQGLEVLNIKAR